MPSGWAKTATAFIPGIELLFRVYTGYNIRTCLRASAAINRSIMTNAVIFDMDGLLLDTERIAVDSWLEAAAAFGLQLTESIVHSTIGINWEGTKRIIEDALGPDVPYERFFDQVNTAYHARLSRGMPLKPGAPELLKALHGAAVPVGLATSTARKQAGWKLESAGLLQYFTGMACGDEVERGKPNPDIFLLSACRIGAEPCCCVVLEDSPAGILGAKAAGMTTIMVPDLLEPSRETMGHADHVVKDLFEAGALLRELMTWPGTQPGQKTAR